MKIEQIYTGCLAQGAYYIECNGEAIVIDPLREVDQYIRKAESDNAKIKYILETHFHADFVSGHVTLAEKTGARIVFGPNAAPKFDAHIAKDGEELKIGDHTMQILHTPGHTMESTTYLLKDSAGKPLAIFSGDTLFLGDVGRPDLAQKAANMTQEQLAGLLFHSLRNKIMTLPDEVIVYPAHGAGSACGKNMSSETVDTLGHQKEVNYALRANMTEAEFIKEVTDGLLPPPAYFPMNVKLNKEGYDSIDMILEKGVVPLDPESFEKAVALNDAIVLDVRNKSSFAKEHVPGSIFIGLDGSFAPWVGAMIKDVDQKIVLVTDDGQEQEAVTRLARVGFDHTLGFLNGGVKAWKASGRETDSVRSVTADELQKEFNPATKIFDVRKESEFEQSHVENAFSTPLDFINDYMDKFRATEDPFYLHCKSGYRSIIAASILKARGVHNFIDVAGGYQDMLNTSLPIGTGKTQNA